MDRARDWWEEVAQAIRDNRSALDDMGGLCLEISQGFAPNIEVQQLAREFQNLRQTIETVA